MLELLQGAALIAATMLMGVMAGVFDIYAIAIMPGLRRTDDRTFIAAFQAIDRAIINPLFMLAFFGALVVGAAALALSLGGDTGSAPPWQAAALVLYLITFAITIRIHVPRTDEIKAAGEPAEISDSVRRRFDESRWARWNDLRALATTAALGCLAWSLVEFGRALANG